MSFSTLEQVNNRYTRVKYEKTKIPKKRVLGKTVLAVSKYSRDHVINPRLATRLLDRAKRFVRGVVRNSNRRDR